MLVDKFIYYLPLWFECLYIIIQGYLATNLRRICRFLYVSYSFPLCKEKLCAYYCIFLIFRSGRRDATRVDKDNIMTRTQLLLMESTSSNSSRLLNETGTEEMSKEMQLISKKQNRTSIGFIREIQRKQILDVAALAASQTVKYVNLLLFFFF